ncbi:MAG: hypothetical protein J7K15_04375 [Deltaproteobacteria bacterium]|nr:hypothetical protein [Deltaproteobacteria bacterium]
MYASPVLFAEDNFFYSTTGATLDTGGWYPTYFLSGNLNRILKYPELPLHNNGSELEVRAEKRRQDVSLQTKTEEGTKAKDTFLTITQTAKKLGVSAYEYIYDRISRQFNMPSLAELIKQRTLPQLE